MAAGRSDARGFFDEMGAVALKSAGSDGVAGGGKRVVSGVLYQKRFIREIGVVRAGCALAECCR